MRILYIHQYFVTPKDKQGTRSYEFAKALVKEGHNVIMLTSDFQGKYKKLITRKNIDGISVIYVKNKYSNKMNFLRRINSFLRFMFISCFIVYKEKKADLVFATSTPLTVGWIGRFKKRISKIPFIFEVRDLWPEIPIEMGIIKNKLLIKFLKFIEKKIYKTADHIIALSPGMKDGIVNSGIEEEKVSIIPNGCDIDLFSRKTKDGAIRTKLNFKKEDIILIFTGAHGKANGLDYIIEAAMISKHIDKIKYVLIGDGSEKERLVQRKNENKLDNIFFINPVSKTELVNYMHDADIGMQILKNIPAFYYGTSPNKFFDYISAGLPVINNYPGWVADMIDEYNCGEVCDPNKPISMVEKVKGLIERRQVLIEYKINAKRLAEERFSRYKLVRNLFDIIETFN